MKKLIIFIFTLSAGVYFNAYSQCSPAAPTGSGGWSPKWPCFECIKQGQPYSQVLGIEIPGTFGPNSPVHIDSVYLDRIENVPTGITYSIHPGKTITRGSTACLDITGTTTDTVGKYKAAIFVKLYTNVIDITTSTELGALLNQLSSFLPPTFDIHSFDYYLRVIGAGDTCAIDDSCTATGIRELSSLNISFAITPNPVKATADLSFLLDKPMNLDVVIYNAVGQRVYNKDVMGVAGANKVVIDRGNLQKGLYLIGLEQDG